MPERKGLAIYNLAQRRTNTIGIIVPKLDSHFITSALKGIGEISSKCGYELVITSSQENMAREVENAQLLFDRRVDGVIASLSGDTERFSHFSAFTDNGIPVVFFDGVQSCIPCDTVVIDNSLCGFLATEHLIRQGCKHIAIVSSCNTLNVYGQRYQGYRKALNKYAIPFTEHLLILSDNDYDSGSDAARTVIKMSPMPDGLFITSDMVAAECISSLKKFGIRVPEDIAVVGFNNDPLASLICPALTTIDYSGLEMGKTAAARLLRHLSDPLLETENSVVPAALIVRDSSIRVPAMHAIHNLS